MTSSKRSREQLAWVAGFWDGEGCVTSLNTSTARGYPAFAVGQSGDEAPTILKRVHDAVQLQGSIVGPYANKKQPQCKPKYIFRISGFANVQALVAMCWPWLSQTKRDQATKVLRNYHELRPVPAVRTNCPRCGCAWVEPNIAYKPESQSWRCRVCRRKNPDASRPAAQYRRVHLEADATAPVRRTRNPQRVQPRSLPVSQRPSA